jgi:hypothetical protein
MLLLSQLLALCMKVDSKDEQAWKKVDSKVLASMLKMTADVAIQKKFYHGHLLMDTPEKPQDAVRTHVGSCLLNQMFAMRNERSLQRYPEEAKISLVACCTRGDIGKCVQDVAPAYQQVAAADEMVKQQGDKAKKEDLEELAAKAIATLMDVGPKWIEGASLSGTADMDLVLMEGVCKLPDDCEAKKIFDGVPAQPDDDGEEDPNYDL